MNYKELAELLYPEVTTTIEDLEKMYPERNLPEGAEVCRFAPSPTGRMHMGNMYAAFIPEVFAHQSNGVFILRIEDTDEKRSIENGIEHIVNDLGEFNYIIDESPVTGGNYGPYKQRDRLNIYHTVAKYLVSIGRAYPCFCTEEELTEMRTHQEDIKDRIGYYGHYAKCRNLSMEEIKKHLENKDKWVLRLKSMGDFNKKVEFNDLIKGKLELPENDIDQVLIKSDGVPPYAFAHVCDDHYMRVTTVTRDDSYISSLTYHLEIWDACGFKAPKFAHLLPLNKKDGDKVRKISKRKDPEAAVAFYHERGIPVEAIKLYFATLVNSNFEEWFIANPDKTYKDFKFTFDKMSTSGSLYDLEKLINISKNYISRLKAEEVFNLVDVWSRTYDKEFNELINKYKDYTINVLNIEREVERPRKDIESFSAVKREIGYMYDELFFNEEKTFERKDYYSKELLEYYIDNVYDEADDKQTWFNKIKEMCPKFGFASETKEYKKNPENYKGSVAHACEVIRVSVTNRTMTPDLYEILKLLGKDRIKERISKF
ncbi:glutamate--tRNA ligase [Clostridium sp. CAG:628]|nr:glutamate--tRNA ligase [Clostridium sp. CAG:628]